MATCSPAATVNCCDAQRAQAAVVLGDAGELENRRGHEPISRLTSSTMRLDSERAAISILTRGEIAGDRAVRDHRVDDRRQHAGVDARAENRRHHRHRHGEVAIEKTGLRAAAMRR